MNNSYDEVNVTDNLFYNMKSHKGFICAPFYDGEKSSFADLFGMKTKSDIPETIRDFICTFGATKGLLFYNTRVHTVESVQDILRQYNIVGMHSDPPQQNQNPAKRQIQEVKATTNLVVDQTGAPPWTCLMCMVYIV